MLGLIILLAAAPVQETLSFEPGNAQVASLRPRPTPEQNADRKKCQAETGWKPDASGKTIN